MATKTTDQKSFFIVTVSRGQWKNNANKIADSKKSVIEDWREKTETRAEKNVAQGIFVYAFSDRIGSDRLTDLNWA